MARVHLALTALWGLLLVPTLLWWQESVPYLVFMSWYSNFVTHWGSWSAARAEEKIDKAGADATREVKV
jgi:hypothetical protein